jgi:SNF2 family DNA or RNA helicase
MILRRKFKPHQLPAFAYAREKAHPALFMEMRLGKTLVTIRRINMYQPNLPELGLKILIVAPNSALGSWEEELKMEGETSLVWLNGARNRRLKRLQAFDAKWYLLNKEGFISVPEVADFRWDVVVLDESTFIKNIKAKVTRYFLRNFRMVPHRWILTGIPNPESDLEYFTQIQFLDNGFCGCGSFWHFRKRFFHPGYGGFGWSPNKGAADIIRYHVGRRAFIQRRKDIGLEGEKVYERRYLEMPADIRKTYRKAEKEYIIEYHGKQIDTTIWAMQKYIWLRQFCGGFIGKFNMVWQAKIEEIINLLTGELKGEQVVIWFNFNNELKATYNKLIENEFKVGRIYGENTAEHNEEERKQFQAKGYQVILVQQASAQTGMNLSAADTAIYYSMPTGLFALKETEDRIFNMDKKSPLLYIYLLVRKSVDIDLYQALKLKGLTNDISLSRALQASLLERNRA